LFNPQTPEEELADNLERIFYRNTAEMRHAQNKHYVSDGKAAMRVYEEILKAYFL
jgi:hypothetical protein